MAENKFETREMLARCVPMSRLQGVLGGKWKILILWYVTFYRIQRFGELMRRLDGITQSSLTKSLRELEEDGFLHREVYGEIPPRVEYSLTEMELRAGAQQYDGLERGESVSAGVRQPLHGSGRSRAR